LKSQSATSSSNPINVGQANALTYKDEEAIAGDE